MLIDEEVYLEHFGVKGMRWGHRKPRDEEARKRRFGKRTQRANRDIKDLEDSLDFVNKRMKNSKDEKERLGWEQDASDISFQIATAKADRANINGDFWSPQKTGVLFTAGLLGGVGALQLYDVSKRWKS